MSEIDLEQIDKEVLPFLSPSSRPDVRAIATQYFLGLTGTPEGLKFIESNDKYLNALVKLLHDDQPVIAKDAYMALVNLTTLESVSWKLLNIELEANFLINLLKYVMSEDSIHADIACSILSNMSRWEACANKILEMMIENRDIVGFDKLIQVFCTVDYNKKANLNYIGPLLSNLTQIKEARSYVLDRERCVVQRLLPYTQYTQSLTRRGGIIGTLKNCCFETDAHDWLLSSSVDILPRLLLPLAGPEEFDEEDMNKLPEDLQYLEPDKKRESDPDIRKMLVESIHQLLARKPCREYIRSKNTYLILRELDNWEEDPAVKAIIHNTIMILLGDEPEPGMEDLDKVDIPSDIETKLQQSYENQQKQIEEERSNLNTGEGGGDN